MAYHYWDSPLHGGGRSGQLSMPKIYEAKTYLMTTAPKYKVEFACKEGSKISTPIFENISAETFSKIILNEHTARSSSQKMA